ncbi:MAG: hypothetical protein KGI82_04730 [Betaproteobacteria bacterium]|nr:hypothetical protein [Betaproteobacteria bacterium]
MHPLTRAGIAYIAGALASGKTGAGVFDYAHCKNYVFSGSVNHAYVSVFDHHRQCHITGHPEQLYDQGQEVFISIILSSTHFTGYDFCDSRAFCGDVDGSTVTFHEQDSMTRFSFRIL